MALKLIDTALVKRKTGKDLFAKDEFDDEEQIAVRWNNEVKEIKDQHGKEFTSISTIYYDNTISLAVGDVLKLQDSDDIFRPIKAISNFRNGSGTKFLNVAYLGNNVR